jgi:hypothetical protein
VKIPRGVTAHETDTSVRPGRSLRLLDLLATGDVVRTGAAVRRYLDLIAR